MQISNITKLFRTTCNISLRLASTSSPRVVLTDDESTFVSWHPKSDFPYECTKPLPEEKVEDDGVLNSKLSPELFSILDKQHPDLARLELMKLTHTTKHKWFPKSRSNKYKKYPKDRTYL